MEGFDSVRYQRSQADREETGVTASGCFCLCGCDVKEQAEGEAANEAGDSGTGKAAAESQAQSQFVEDEGSDGVEGDFDGEC